MRRARYNKTLVFMLLVGLLEAKSRNGDKLLAEGQAAESSKQYDRALDLYEQALSADPADAGYQLATRRVRFQAAQFHVERGYVPRRGL